MFDVCCESLKPRSLLVQDHLHVCAWGVLLVVVVGILTGLKPLLAVGFLLAKRFHPSI